MAKYRVIESNGVFIPQKRGWFWWKNFYDYTLHLEVEMRDTIAFTNQENAIDYLLDQTKHMKKKTHEKVVFQYEE